MNAEEVEGTTQTKCCEGECGERELEQPSAWWIPMNHCSTVFFNPLLLAIEYPTALNVLDRCLRLQGLGDRPQICFSLPAESPSGDTSASHILSNRTGGC